MIERKPRKPATGARRGKTAGASAPPERSTEERIRARAYALWEEEGRPHGRAEAHWDMASELVAIEENQRSTLLPRDTGAGPTVEPREAIENQGEMPELRDQGDSDEPVRPARRRAAGRG